MISVYSAYNIWYDWLCIFINAYNIFQSQHESARNLMLSRFVYQITEYNYVTVYTQGMNRSIMTDFSFQVNENKQALLTFLFISFWINKTNVFVRSKINISRRVLEN